jgi:RNase P subunit RPR2
LAAKPQREKMILKSNKVTYRKMDCAICKRKTYHCEVDFTDGKNHWIVIACQNCEEVEVYKEEKDEEKTN